jgi:hypothetical protein
LNAKETEPVFKDSIGRGRFWPQLCANH